MNTFIKRALIGTLLAGGITLKVLETRPRIVARDGERTETRVFIDPQDVQILKE